MLQRGVKQIRGAHVAARSAYLLLSPPPDEPLPTKPLARPSLFASRRLIGEAVFVPSMTKTAKQFESKISGDGRDRRLLGELHFRLPF
jgi:hypothetical protein